MIRGAEGQTIFREDKDRHNFLSRIAEISEDTGARHENGSTTSQAIVTKGEGIEELKLGAGMPNREVSLGRF